MLWLYVFIFIISCVSLGLASSWVIGALTRIARFLCWREFVVAFFIMAFASSMPNLFVGISSALRGIPELSFGDVVGGNVIDFTLVIALAAILANGLPAGSKMVQTSLIFTVILALLPLLLVANGTLSRLDGVILISAFFVYAFWLFSKQERFSKEYKDDDSCSTPTERFKGFFKDSGIILLGGVVLLLAAQGIVVSASFLATALNLPLAIVGILIVGFGNALPETYFSIMSARRGHSWLIFGNLMGSVVVPATLVLGVVALIHPIVITDFSPFAIARIFLILSAFLFFVFGRSGQKITRKEAILLLGLYVAFVLIEIFIK